MRYLPLAAILVLGATLRLFLLWTDAPPLFADELDGYVSVQNIVSHGVDIDGTLQPFLYSPLERHPPIYGLTAYASTRVLGNTPFGWRFPAAVFGIISIALLYLLVFELTGRRPIALLAALLFAIEPIQVHFSRIGWPPATVLPFLLGALWLLLRALRGARPDIPFPRLAAAAVLVGLCPYTYGASWLYTLILVTSLFALNPRVFRRRANRPKLLAATAIALAIAGPGLLVEFTDPHTVERATHISTFFSGVNGDSIGVFFNHYFSHFGWPYLAVTGSGDAHYMSGHGVLYWWYVPLIITGAFYAHRYVRSRALEVWMWVWLLAYPLGGALTNDGATAHPARTIPGSPILCIFAGVGCYALVHIGSLIESQLWRRRYRLGLAAALLVCTAGSVWSFSRWYFTVYPIASAQAWESGAREAFASVRAHESGYARVCLSGFNSWHVDTLQRYFLAGTPLTVIENPNDAACLQARTLVLATQPFPSSGLVALGTTFGADGKPFATLEARDVDDVPFPAPVSNGPR